MYNHRNLQDFYLVDRMKVKIELAEKALADIQAYLKDMDDKESVLKAIDDLRLFLRQQH